MLAAVGQARKYQKEGEATVFGWTSPAQSGGTPGGEQSTACKVSRYPRCIRHLLHKFISYSKTFREDVFNLVPDLRRDLVIPRRLLGKGYEHEANLRANRFLWSQ